MRETKLDFPAPLGAAMITIRTFIRRSVPVLVCARQPFSLQPPKKLTLRHGFLIQSYLLRARVPVHKNPSSYLAVLYLKEAGDKHQRVLLNERVLHLYRFDRAA